MATKVSAFLVIYARMQSYFRLPVHAVSSPIVVQKLCSVYDRSMCLGRPHFLAGVSTNLWRSSGGSGAVISFCVFVQRCLTHSSLFDSPNDGSTVNGCTVHAG